MPPIQSNHIQSKEYSQLLLTKAQALEEVPLPATMDYQTTVAGNQTAHQVMEKSRTISQQIATALTGLAEKIDTVATHFEETDQHLATSFGGKSC